MNVLPLPSSLSTVMSPPIMWQKWRLMASPSPVPPYLLAIEGSAWVNGRNSFFSCSGPIPIPVSRMRKWIHSIVSTRQRSTFKVISPFSVNFDALLSRLNKHWRTLVTSVSIDPRCSPISQSRVFPFSLAST